MNSCRRSKVPFGDSSTLIWPQQIPQTLRNYIGYLEKQLGVPIRYLSVGPDRRQTLIMD